MMVDSLSIVTITYNNFEDFLKTYNSLKLFRKNGGTHILINGGASINQLIEEDCVLVEESDSGIYDALNKGIGLVQTPYFMLIHSGDFLVADLYVLEEQLALLTSNHLDILLNDCTIELGEGKRLMSSKNWMPWMFKLGAQPPHPPTIYRTKALKAFKYDLNHPIIADFKYLEELFCSNIRWDKGNKVLIHMSAGGATSSGLKSYFFVNEQFRKLKGPIRMILYSFSRPLIKIYQMI